MQEMARMEAEWQASEAARKRKAAQEAATRANSVVSIYQNVELYYCST